MPASNRVPVVRTLWFRNGPRPGRGSAVAKIAEAAGDARAGHHARAASAHPRLPAADFAPLVGISKHTLYAWQKLPEARTRQPAGIPDSGSNAARISFWLDSPPEHSLRTRPPRTRFHVITVSGIRRSGIS
jgi:hypothetical protein